MTDEMMRDAEAFMRIKENIAKLDNCVKHKFTLDAEPPYQFGMKLTCENCQGEMKAVDAFRYVQGYKAAGGNPNEVIPGYE